MASPLRGDRAAYDDVNYPGLHAKDLDDSSPLHHLPTATTEGQVPSWDGSKWIAAAISGEGIYVSDTDPGAVGADKLWVDTSVGPPYTLKVRNSGNTDWEVIGGSGSDDNAIHDNVSGEIAALSEKASPVGADLILIEDSEASNAKKKVQISNLPGGSPSTTDGPWEPDLPPQSGSAYDDEFDDSSFDTGLWDTLDEDTELFIDEDDYGLQFEYVYNSDEYLTGILQSLPGGSYTITAKVMPVMTPDINTWSGLMLTNANSGSGVDAVALFVRLNESYDIEVELAYWQNLFRSGPLTGMPTPSFSGLFGMGPFYFRMSANTGANAFIAQASNDGKSWLSMYQGSYSGLPITPSYMGLGICSADADFVRFQYFRYQNSSITGTPDVPVKGRKMQLI